MLRDLYYYLYHQSPTGGIPLKGTGIALGLLLLAVHLWALLRGEKAKAFLRAFPRSYPWGVALLAVGFVWSMMVMQATDMGEYFFLRRWLLFLLPVAFVLVISYVKEFLAVRALGSLMLLAAAPVLYAAFLQPQTSRLLLPILAYAWIIGGMFLVGMPYLMRDGVDWLLKSDGRWKAAVGFGIGYGAVLLVAALLWY